MEFAEEEYNITSYNEFKKSFEHLTETEIKTMYQKFVESTIFYQDLDTGIYD